MTKLILPFLLLLCLPLHTNAHGVAVVNAQNGTILQLISSNIQAAVTNQVAHVTTTQVFKNDLGVPAAIGYAFPMHPDASAIQLRWNTGGAWKYATVQSGPQDPLPGGGSGGVYTDPDLAAYLGGHALQFDPKETLQPDSAITFELTYVELLPYRFNKVSFHYPNNYNSIQESIIEETIQFQFTLHSGRSITTIDLLSHTATSSSNDGHLAEVHYAVGETAPDKDIALTYELASNELGILDMSTQLPDSVVTCDDFGSGFLTLVIEPESNANTQVIQKNFVLVIDHSGSMSGEKMVQARDASSFIMQHLNPADQFNIISFDESITLFKPGLVDYNTTTENEALDFISNQQAEGSTNISGALTTAVSQFSVSDQGQANIILFFTDGEATAGITNTPGILQAVAQAVQVAETDIFLFAFGIGSDVNKSLLTQLATNNSGLAEFLGSDELAAKITEFFLYVNNPVLLNTQVSFDPPLVTETWPSPLPNLYKGQQLILSGRYSQPGPVTMTLSGKAFNAPVSYQYNFTLADSASAQYQFLPKLWAKSKIGALTTDYYITGDTNLLHTITDISGCYGVISDFTSFHPEEPGGGGGNTAIEEVGRTEATPTLEVLPNPTRGAVLLRLPKAVQSPDGARAYVFDVQGHLLRTFELTAGQSEFSWDGLDASGNALPAGVYFVAVVDGERVMRGQVVRI